MRVKQFNASSVIAQMNAYILSLSKQASRRFFIYDDVIDATRYSVESKDTHDLNYIFGRALLNVEHPQAKEYHRMHQRGKTKFRQAFERKGRSDHPHMLKHRMAYDAYDRERKIAKVIAVLEKS
jgi:hypothetical protein